MKIPASKAAVDKEWEQVEKFSVWNLTKVRSKKEGSKDDGRKSSFCITDGHVSFEKMLTWRQSTKNTKVELYFEVIL